MWCQAWSTAAAAVPCAAGKRANSFLRTGSDIVQPLQACCINTVASVALSVKWAVYRLGAGEASQHLATRALAYAVECVTRQLYHTKCFCEAVAASLRGSGSLQACGQLRQFKLTTPDCQVQGRTELQRARAGHARSGQRRVDHYIRKVSWHDTNVVPRCNGLCFHVGPAWSDSQHSCALQWSSLSTHEPSI